MDPNTILRRAREEELNVIGITDHNSTRQARLIKMEEKNSGLFILAGAEINTREEIHCLAFFDDYETLDVFQEYLDRHLPDIKNNPDYFGDQVVVDFQGNIRFEESRLLISGIDQSLADVAHCVRELGGMFIPAHVNRKSYSLLSQLGFIPDDLKAEALEWCPDSALNVMELAARKASKFTEICSSDAHYPSHIGQRYTEMEVEEVTFEGLRAALQSGINVTCCE